MGKRIEQINELLHHELANLIVRDLPLTDSLITITSVNCSADLRHAKIYVSILPENKSGTALKALRRYSSVFSSVLKTKLKLKLIPRFNWQFDSTEKDAVQIEKLLDQIKSL